MFPASPAAHRATLYYVAFPTSYLAESGLNWVTYLLSKVRNRKDAQRWSSFITDQTANGHSKTYY